MVLACPWVHALISDGRSNAGLPLVGAALAGGTQLPCPEHVRCVVMVLQFLTCAEFSQFACALLDVRRTHHGSTALILGKSRHLFSLQVGLCSHCQAHGAGLSVGACIDQ